ncbi:MAG: galactose-1-phosphate uridylyltransferase [Firmicutes bacterium]|nr:galactose-1-phosphate uridylyltransferase [Bacillota bacterium]
MTELRYNPLLRDWTMVASHRQNRPQMPKDYCPFCPGSGKVPDDYQVFAYDNDFPALSAIPPVPDVAGSALYPVQEAYGKCEVILYSPDHSASLSRLPVRHIRQVVDLWTERFIALSENPKHKYILIFENRGPEVGVTMPHPHGQIYAYPYIPQKLRVELEACHDHLQETGHCLICDMAEQEKQSGLRIIKETQHFLCFIPFFTDYPYGAFIVSKVHCASLVEFTDAQKDDLAAMLHAVAAGMDGLFDREFPYMMALHQGPVNGPDATESFHFHIEFYPPLRSRDRIKYLASSETAAWAPCNPTAVEDTAPQLREAVLRAEAQERGQ